jgi:hypothetical protein
MSWIFIVNFLWILNVGSPSSNQVLHDLLAQLTHQGPGFNYNKEHIVNTS